MTEQTRQNWTFAQMLAGMCNDYYAHLRQRAIDKLYDGDKAAFEAFVKEKFAGSSEEFRDADIFLWLSSVFPAKEKPATYHTNLSSLSKAELFEIHQAQATLVGLSVEEFRAHLKARVPGLAETPVDRSTGLLHDMSDKACRERFLRRSSGL